MRLSLDDCVSVDDQVVFTTLDDEAVLLHLEQGVYFGLDPVGTRVWQALVARGTARPAVAALLDEYDVTADVLEGDVLRLLAELDASGLIHARG